MGTVKPCVYSTLLFFYPNKMMTAEIIIGKPPYVINKARIWTIWKAGCLVITRSRLYPLEPKGIGTPYVESVISYIRELAERHSVSIHDLINCVLVPEMGYNGKIHSKATSLWIIELRGLINGPLYAPAIISALERLTLRTDLSCLNFARFPDLKGMSGLVRQRRAWCPECLEESIRSECIYEQLLWTMQVVTCCPKHRIYLSDRCPQCGNTIPHGSWNGVNGYCNVCNCFLGLSRNREIVREIDVELSLAVGDFLSQLAYEKTDLSQSNITDGIRYIINKKFKGNRTEFSKHLGIHKGLGISWYRGKAVPDFPAIVGICYKFNLDITNFIFGSHLPDEIKERDSITLSHILAALRAKRTYSFKRLNKDEIKSHLNACLASNEPPISVNCIARRLGIAAGTLRNLFKEETKSISSKYKKYCLQIKKERLKKLRDEVRNAAIALYQQGVYPSYPKVMNLVQINTNFRQDFAVIKDELNKTKHSLGM